MPHGKRLRRKQSRHIEATIRHRSTSRSALRARLLNISMRIGSTHGSRSAASPASFAVWRSENPNRTTTLAPPHSTATPFIGQTELLIIGRIKFGITNTVPSSLLIAGRGPHSKSVFRRRSRRSPRLFGAEVTLFRSMIFIRGSILTAAAFSENSRQTLE